MSGDRVSRTGSALYGEPVRSRKRRRCGGHLAAKPHMIEVGEPVVWSALPPNSEIGNEGWWHAAFCANCAPIESLPALAALTPARCPTRPETPMTPETESTPVESKACESCGCGRNDRNECPWCDAEPAESTTVVLTEAERAAINVAVDEAETCACCGADYGSRHVYAAVTTILADRHAALLAEVEHLPGCDTRGSNPACAWGCPVAAEPDAGDADGLTEGERTLLLDVAYAYANPFEADNPTPEWLGLVATVDHLLATRVREAEQRGAEHERRDWSSWLDNWLSAIGPTPPTVEQIATALRSGPRPFGVARADASRADGVAGGEVG